MGFKPAFLLNGTIMKSITSLTIGAAILGLGIIIGLMIANPDAVISGEDAPAAEETQTSADAQASSESAAQDSSNNWAAGSTTSDKLGEEHVRRVVANLGAAERERILDEKALFVNLVEQEARNHSVTAAAHDNNMTANDNVRFLMQRAANNVLREAYLNTLMNEQLADDFPTEEQVSEFYDDNRDSFRASDRIQVWQIFLPVSEEGLTADEAEARSRTLFDQIKAGELSFADAAVEHSAHATSRQNDGYMGAVPTGQLKPEVAEALADVGEDEMTRIQSEDGWHILKKGRTLEGRQLSLDEVEPRIRQTLQNRARQEFRQAVSERAMEAHAFMPEDSEIDAWWQALKSGINN
ncbi:parvulin-like peptidyl-prolyl isomerase [Methylohalomonas lacus]|uniref:peptidylprolyl isomerase n=1 Tax=Methylohalomonas lacus TaxID=398773 RepID=A0AAE3L104_9GAMM|nr:peptidylprolyl isomerase [Methylohalomonas lacus]MCS3902456.1 parvulin-like peptidyl-prolyl isomerase [Methylohalomonas lacus]